MTLQPYVNNDIELIIDTTNGESFASQAGYSRMAGVNYRTIRMRVSRLKEATGSTLKSTQILTQQGFRDVTLIPEDVIADWIVEDNPTVAKQLMRVGVRCFLHKLAGFEVSSTAVQQQQLPTDYLSALKALVVSEEEKQRLEAEKRLIEEQKQVVEKEHAKVTVKLEEAEDTLNAYRGLFSDDTNTLTFKQVADALGIPGYGRNNLFKFMRRKGGICTTSSEVRRSFIDRGYLISVPKQRTTPSGKLEPYNQAKFTIKGVAWLIKRLIESGETVKITAEQIWDNYQLNVNAMSDF